MQRRDQSKTTQWVFLPAGKCNTEFIAQFSGTGSPFCESQCHWLMEAVTKTFAACGPFRPTRSERSRSKNASRSAQLQVGKVELKSSKKHDEERISLFMYASPSWEKAREDFTQAIGIIPTLRLCTTTICSVPRRALISNRDLAYCTMRIATQRYIQVTVQPQKLRLRTLNEG